MATQTMTLQAFSDCDCGCGGSSKSYYDRTVPDPGVSGDLQQTSNGTCINTRSYTGGTYSFDYSADSTTCSDCLKLPLKSGGELEMSWNRMSGQDSLASAYPDTWMPGGSSSVFSFLPRVTLNDLTNFAVQRVYSKSSPVGTVTFDSTGFPGAELPIIANHDPSPVYFTTYDQKAGIYFEYFGGTTLPTSDSRYGRVNRRYDTKGNVLQYNYTNNASGKALLRTISGDVGGNLTPSFFYADETINTTHFAPITKIALIDNVVPGNTRTVYFEYTNQVDPGGNTRPYLTKIVNPMNCVEQFAPVVPFPLGDPGDPYQINNDIDAGGFGTSFTYSGGLMATVIEPESRTTYCEYPTVGETRQIQQGRNKRVVKYALSSSRDQLTRVGQHTDPLGNTTYYSYDTFLSRMKYQVDPNGNFTYYEYNPGNYNQYALSKKVSTFNQASTVFGYDLLSYDPLKKVGPRWQAGTNIEVTYYRYDASRNRTAIVDALGNNTLYGPDALGRNVRVQDQRGNTTYYNYSASTGSLDSVFDPLGNVTYYGYNSFRNRTATVSPRWKEQSFPPFTTYFVYDQLNRRTKIVDPQQNVTYFDYDARGNLIDTVNPVKTVSATVYNGLSLKITETVTDGAGKLLEVTYHGYDQYKNKVRTQNGRGFTSYFTYDQLNRLTLSRDALANTTYFGYSSMGNRTAMRDARGNSTYYFYDLLTRNNAVRDALGNLTYYFYDAADQKTSQVDALKFPTYYFYDALDRPSVTRDALGNLTYYFYDAVGNRTATVDAAFDPTYHFYDALNREVVTRDALGNKTYFGYDAAGNRTRVKDARNNTTYFTFDTLDRKNRKVDALANPTYFGYDGASNRTRVMDARFNTTYYFFDGLKRTAAMKDAGGNSTYYFYDLTGNQTALRDPRGNTTYYFYDPLNRNSAIRDSSANAVYFGYDQVNNLVRSVDGRFNTTYFTFDNLNRRTAVIDPAGNALLSGYDAVGNLTKTLRGAVAGAGGVATYYAYDGIRRRTAMKDAIGGATYFFYDRVGNQTGQKNPLQHTSYYGYDALDRMVRSQDPTGATSYFEYDAVGNQTKIVDADNHATQSRFDALNRQDAVRAADAGSTYFFYDQVSNRTKDVDPLGNACYYKYDQTNRLTAIQDALGRNVYFEYDGASNRTKYLDGETASAVFAYDSINRLTNITYATAGAVVADGLRSNPYFVYDRTSNLTQIGDLWGLHRMGYDADNRMSQHQFPNGNVVYFRYDPRSNVTARVYPGTAGNSGAAYDNLDRQTKVQAPSGVTAYFVYDAASNLTLKLLGNNSKLVALYDLAERVSQWRNANSAGASLTYFDYTRDAKGLITKAVREATNTVYYTYDANDRLMSELWAKTGASPSEVYGYRYAYDLAGNRTKLRANGVNTYYAYDKANQLTMKGTTSAFASATYYKYDQNGSLTDLIEPSGTTKFAYNAAGLVGKMRWKDASFTYFFYDGQLRRYALNQNGTLNYFLWDGLDLLQELKSDHTVQEEYTQAKSPIPGIRQLVEVNRPGVAPQKIYPVQDSRGSITKYLQSDGTTVVASREYDSFGNLIPNSAVGTWPGIFGYQGQAWKEIKSANGAQRLMLSPTRLYDPVDGKFLSKDITTMGALGIVPKLILPVYLYANQNAVIAVDPNGRETWQQIREHRLDAMGNVVSPWGNNPNGWTTGWGTNQRTEVSGFGWSFAGGFGGGGAGSVSITNTPSGQLQTWTCGDGRVYNYIDMGGRPIGNPCTGGGGGAGGGWGGIGGLPGLICGQDPNRNCSCNCKLDEEKDHPEKCRETPDHPFWDWKCEGRCAPKAKDCPDMECKKKYTWECQKGVWKIVGKEDTCQQPAS